jgi:hypothetical protein
MTHTVTTPSRTRSLSTILTLLLLGSSPSFDAAAAEPGAGRISTESAVTLTLADLGQGGYRVTGEFDVPARQSLAWAVLSDYDRIGDFVSSVRKSVILERGPDHVLLEQEGSGKVFIFSKRVHVVLHVTEEDKQAIVFHDVSGRDFSRYDGRWDVTRTNDNATHVSYVLNATLKSRKPGFLVRGSMQESARGLLEQVRAEIVRRTPARPLPPSAAGWVRESNRVTDGPSTSPR